MLKPCKTLEEFVRYNDKDLEKILAGSFKNYINLENLPEVKNDVYIHLVEKNFFTSYDPEKSAFSTYLYTYLKYYLKDQRKKEARKPDYNAPSIDQKVYQDGNVTLMDVQDFKSNDRKRITDFESSDLDIEIQNLLDKRKKLKIYNPYQRDSLYGAAWDFLETPRTFEELKLFVFESDFLYKNPYDPKKDSIKHQIWEQFKKKTIAEITEENELWAHVGGVKSHQLSMSDMAPLEKRVFTDVKELIPCTYFETLLQLKDLKRRWAALHRLYDKGFLDGDLEVTTNTKPFYRFQRVENMVWHLIMYFQEKHPELMGFDNEKYHLDTQSNPTFKFFRMVLNGKTNKEIASTYRVNTNTFLSTKRAILKDVKRLI